MAGALKRRRVIGRESGGEDEGEHWKRQKYWAVGVGRCVRGGWKEAEGGTVWRDNVNVDRRKSYDNNTIFNNN